PKPRRDITRFRSSSRIGSPTNGISSQRSPWISRFSEQTIMRKQQLIHLSWIVVLVLTLVAQNATAQAPAGQERWLATWGAAMQQPAATTTYSNQTLRMFVRASVGGRRVRVQLSNTFGTAPLVLGPVHVALHSEGSAIVSGSDRALLFSGKPTVKIP